MYNQKCVFCGNNLIEIFNEIREVVKYKCTNEACPNPVKEWGIAEHIDNQHWEINKVRELETRLSELEVMVSNLTLALQNHLK